MEEFRSIQNQNNESLSVSKNPDKKKPARFDAKSFKYQENGIKDSQHTEQICNVLQKYMKNAKESERILLDHNDVYKKSHVVLAFF